MGAPYNVAVRNILLFALLFTSGAASAGLCRETPEPNAFPLDSYLSPSLKGQPKRLTVTIKGGVLHAVSPQSSTRLDYEFSGGAVRQLVHTFNDGQKMAIYQFGNAQAGTGRFYLNELKVTDMFAGATLPTLAATLKKKPESFQFRRDGGQLLSFKGRLYSGFSNVFEPGAEVTCTFQRDKITEKTVLPGMALTTAKYLLGRQGEVKEYVEEGQLFNPGTGKFEAFDQQDRTRAIFTNVAGVLNKKVMTVGGTKVADNVYNWTGREQVVIQNTLKPTPVTKVSFKFDQKGNWVERATYQGDQLYELITRVIQY